MRTEAIQSAAPIQSPAREHGQKSPHHRSRRVALVFAFVFALCALALGAACSKNDGATPTKSDVAKSDAAKPDTSKASAPDGKGAPRPALTVTVTRPESAQWPLTLSANGSVTAWQEASVGAEAAGLRISNLLVNVGDVVKRGQMLAQLSEATVQVDLAQQRAAIAEAEATLAHARLDAERARKLDQTGAISAQQINQLLTAERTAEARLEVARARLRNDEIRLTQTRIVAPDDGIISARSAMLGAVVQPGQELFRLIRQGRLEWRAEVTAAELARIKPKQGVAIEAANGAKSSGTVRMIGPTVDPQTRMAIVYVDIPANSGASAGMFARGAFDLGATEVSAVPQAAVLRREGFDYVFVLEAGSRVKLTKVDVGRRSGDRAELTTRLPEGTQIVASGVGFLNDGDLVRVAPPQ